MNLEELRKLREEQKQSLSRRNTDNKDIQIIVGMGTCGIAAGAKDTLEAFIQELEEQELSTVRVTQTGCMGLCYVEPTVEIVMPDMPDVIYGKVDPDVARKIIRKHIMNKTMVNDHVFDRPAADIVEEGGNQ
ncbi:MAG: (2Fe-2S) ferredoxin domain-containing protein [Spirochaetaceae bacterium]|nr:(2Fe-2S) ferredoxin domain-containing protein [Spirochaetaceae bacterium]MCF7947554.1 (2Fe-2S) ferredoxin domain-containing protein [Spirochaetia bacterium]MCF7950478.1 (2Fe-2S) ferredoxin domain-containing protein [Spirochaetaceae bacterium]